jgi:thioredoxin 1
MRQPGPIERQLLLSQAWVMSRRSLAWPLAGIVALGVGLGTAVHTLSKPAPAAAAEDAVQQTLRAGKPTVVEFGANNCASCREMKSVPGQLARERGDRISVVDIDLLQTTGYIGRYKIVLMPTQVFFDAQGRETGRHMGKISAEEILARLQGPTP